MRSTREIKDEIRGRMGFVPAFLELAADVPGMLEGLWLHTRAAYLDNVLPGLLKEQILTYLSHCCEVPYCTAWHACALRLAGASADQILALLEQPDLDALDALDARHTRQAPGALDEHLTVLAGTPAPLIVWPELGSPLQRALLAAAAAEILGHDDAAAARQLVMRLLGRERYASWVMFLGYIRSYHQWIVCHPELSYEHDERIRKVLPRLLAEQPGLSALLLPGTHDPASAGGQERPPATGQRSEREAWARLESAAQWRAILDSAPVGCIQIAASGEIRFANAQAAQIFGYRQDELIGQPVEKLVPVRFQHGHPELRAAFFASPQVRQMGAERHVHGLRRDGSEVPLEIGLAPDRSHGQSDGQQGAIATIVDITARKQAEETLRRVSDVRERLIQLPFTTAGTRVLYDELLDLLLDVFDSQFGFVGYIDEHGALACPSMTRDIWEQCAVPGKAIVFPRRVWGGLWGRVLLERKCLIKNETHGVPTGHLPIHCSMGAPLIYRGELIGSLHVANRDWGYDEIDARVMEAIADQIAPLLAAHRAEEELKRSNAELENFAYVASHDLQEPLRMVAGYAELLARRYKGQLDERADKYLGYIADGTLRMQRLINDVLVFARAGTKRVTLDQIPCEQVLEKVLRDLEVVILESGAQITWDSLPTLVLDVSQIAQVFSNLISNAIKFRGSVPPRIHILSRRDGAEWLFGVSDNGIGIAAEHSQKVFEMFQRLHSREQYPGNGIGLSLAKKIVERHGGRIWFESSKGQGTTFYFTLPMEVSEIRLVSGP